MIPFLFIFFFRLHKVRGISWLSEDLSTSQEGLFPIELVIYFMSLYVSAVCIKLMDKLETLSCVLRVTHPEKICIGPLDWFPKEPQRCLWLGGGVCRFCRMVKGLKANQSYRRWKRVGLVWNQWLLRVPVTAVLRASSGSCAGWWM